MPFEVKVIWTDSEAIYWRDQLLEAYPLEVEPPVEPPIEPPIEPPPTNPGSLMPLGFRDVWGSNLQDAYGNYPAKDIVNRRSDGTSMAIRLPVVSKDRQLRITDIEHNGTQGRRYGELSWGRVFGEQVIDSQIWGYGTPVKMTVTPAMGGATVYFNWRILDNPFAPWWGTLTAMFR